jgi:type IV secretory pathway VirB10-like protein
MKLSKYFLVIILLLSINLRAEVESDGTDFLAKEKERTFQILNYKATAEEKKKAEEEAKKKEEELHKQKELEESRKRNAKLQKINEEKEITEAEEQRKLEAEQKREAQRQKLLAQKQAEDEARRKRVSKYKLVLAGEKDRVNLQGQARDEFYMEDYSEIGTPEDYSSSIVIRDNIATTDMYVRLLLETNINSRRGGEYVAVVEKDVFSFDSQKILIPKGSKFICKFEPLTAYGETALESDCFRVYFPDGKSMLINAPVSDVMGRAGMVGELDNRMWEKYGQTFSLSVLSGMAMLGADKVPNSDVGSLAQYTALNTIDLSTKFLEKTIDLAPVVVISSGARIIVKLAVDVNLEPREEDKEK